MELATIPKVKQKSAIEIIDETLYYYTLRTRMRSKVDKHGAYYSFQYKIGNRKCSYARCCKPDTNLSHYTGNVSTFADKVEEYLKPEYRGHSIEFWEDIQWLHDCDSYWKGCNLTPKGLKFVNDLKIKYKT